MRHKFFLAYLPLMILMGFISIWVAKRYNGVATMSGYRIDKSNTAGYDGVKIKDLSNNDRKALISKTNTTVLQSMITASPTLSRSTKKPM